MANPHATSSGRWTGAIIALLGAGLCAASALGRTEAACFTDGCALFRDYAFLGVSLWWWGTAGFLAIALPALLGKTRLAFSVACLALVVDAGPPGLDGPLRPLRHLPAGGPVLLGAFLALLPPPGRGGRRPRSWPWSGPWSSRPTSSPRPRNPFPPGPSMETRTRRCGCSSPPNCPACRDTVAIRCATEKMRPSFPWRNRIGTWRTSGGWRWRWLRGRTSPRRSKP